MKPRGRCLVHVLRRVDSTKINEILIRKRRNKNPGETEILLLIEEKGCVFYKPGYFARANSKALHEIVDKNRALLD